MKAFRPFLPEQSLLLPHSLDDWLPEKHLARFVAETVGQLNLRGIYASYEDDGRGQAAYHPELMVRLLLYAYATGRFSSRKIERATYEDVAFRYLAANQHPDHVTIAEFRRRHLQAIAALFVQVFILCQRAGLTSLGHVAIDGTKLAGHAGRTRGVSYERMGEEEKRLSEEVAKLLTAAEQVDQAEDAAAPPAVTELPAELATRQKRLEAIRQAKRDLEREAREKAEQEKAAVEERLAEIAKQEQETGRKFRGKRPTAPDPAKAEPGPKQQRCLTDPDARLMKEGGKRSFCFGYNAQAAVDSKNQVIVAATVTQDQHDRAQLAPVVAQVHVNVGRKPEKVSADTGYYNPKLEDSGALEAVDVYVVPDAGRGKRARAEWTGPAPPPEAPLLTRLRYKMAQPAAREIYGKRKTIVEPVFGQIKEQQGFRRFSFRGKLKVSAEWAIVCLTHNLRKLNRARMAPATA